MRQRALLLWSVLWQATTMLAVTAAPGQQKYRLQDAAASGDCSTNESSLELSLKVQATANGQSAGEFSLVRRDHEKYNEQVLADEAGSPSRIRRTYTLSRSIESDPTGAEKPRVTALQGKTVTIERHGGKVTVTATPGELTAEDRDTLADALDDSADQFFPDREVTPGEEWPIWIGFT